LPAGTKIAASKLPLEESLLPSESKASKDIKNGPAIEFCPQRARDSSAEAGRSDPSNSLPPKTYEGENRAEAVRPALQRAGLFFQQGEKKFG
jgi:hypothetical protein